MAKLKQADQKKRAKPNQMKEEAPRKSLEGQSQKQNEDLAVIPTQQGCTKSSEPAQTTSPRPASPEPEPESWVATFDDLFPADTYEWVTSGTMGDEMGEADYTTRARPLNTPTRKRKLARDDVTSKRRRTDTCSGEAQPSTSGCASVVSKTDEDESWCPTFEDLFPGDLYEQITNSTLGDEWADICPQHKPVCKAPSRKRKLDDDVITADTRDVTHNNTRRFSVESLRSTCSSRSSLASRASDVTARTRFDARHVIRQRSHSRLRRNARSDVNTNQCTDRRGSYGNPYVYHSQPYKRQKRC